MKPLQGHWQIMRDEALALNADGAIAVATGYNDIGFNSFFVGTGKKAQSKTTQCLLYRQVGADFGYFVGNILVNPRGLGIQ